MKGAVKDAVAAVAYAAIDVATARRGIPRRVDGVTLRFPPRWSRYYPRSYAPAQAAFIAAHCRPGATVVDLGAHLGLYTVMMARSVGDEGKVIALEPTPQTFAALRRTLTLNGCDNVELRSEAIAGSCGRRILQLTATKCSNSNSLVTQMRTGQTVEVDAVTLDSLLDRRTGAVTLVKLDVEGAELEALHGARETIARLRPAMALAIHPVTLPGGSNDVSAIWDLLITDGYRLECDGRVIDRSWFCSQDAPFEVGAAPL